MQNRANKRPDKDSVTLEIFYSVVCKLHIIVQLYKYIPCNNDHLTRPETRRTPRHNQNLIPGVETNACLSPSVGFYIKTHPTEKF